MISWFVELFHGAAEMSTVPTIHLTGLCNDIRSRVVMATHNLSKLFPVLVTLNPDNVTILQRFQLPSFVFLS